MALLVQDHFFLHDCYHHSTAKRHEYHGQNFLFDQNSSSFVLHTAKTVPFIFYAFFSVFFQNVKKLKGKFLTHAKQTIKNFDIVKLILLLKFIFFGCTIVRSKALLYMSTPHCKMAREREKEVWFDSA